MFFQLNGTFLLNFEVLFLFVFQFAGMNNANNSKNDNAHFMTTKTSAHAYSRLNNKQTHTDIYTETHFTS